MPRHGKVKHSGCASATHATQNAFLTDLTQGCVHTAKWITTPGKQSNAEMEDTCKNKAGLLQREPKAPADVLFISTLITDCCGMVLWTGKEKLTHCLLRTSFHRSRLWGSCWQGLRHETTTPSWERYGLRKHGALLEHTWVHRPDNQPLWDENAQGLRWGHFHFNQIHFPKPATAQPLTHSLMRHRR